LLTRIRSFLWLAFLAGVIVFADGGAVLLSKDAGPFTITLFGSSDTLRAVKTDLSVMVQRQSDKSNVLDATAMVKLRKREGGNIVEVAAPATRKDATNKLLYAAHVTIPTPGRWTVAVDVRAHGSEATVTGDVQVLPAETPMKSRWAYVVLVPVMIVLFIINRWLRRKRRDFRLEARR